MEIGLPFKWDFDLGISSRLLSDINEVAHRPAPFRIDTAQYKVYWAGTIIRVDIKASELTEREEDGETTDAH